jgi:ABC-2 type transport system ATP-binding protein
VLRLDGVWLRYGRRGVWVLRDVTAALGPGEVAVVQGRNGVGKSTLLQVVAGVLRPSRGAVRERPPVVGWVPERFPADQPFTVDQYLSFAAGTRGAPRSAVADWTERLGIADYRSVRLNALSKGTAQKVGLAQALLRRPDLLILDEPWEGLDAATRDLVPELVAEVVEAGGGVLISDHRGETGRIPGATAWTVAEGRVAVGASVEEPWIIEIAVDPAEAAGVATRLRDEGHDVLRVRPSGVPR